MKLKLILPLVLFQLLTSVSGQISSTFSTLENNLIKPYQEYFSSPREHVYIHFNKSSYVPGDNIWFKCYVIDPKTKLLSLITKNLIVELYCPEGKLIEQRILHVNNGVADNAFSLDLESASGKYTFRAYTNWMKNFGDLKDFTTYLTVLGEQQHEILTGEIDFDVQFLPESGTLLEGLSNKVAIKALDPKDTGVMLYGDIIDDNEKHIKSFELNDMGMGSITLDIVPGTKLKSRINLPDGRTVTYPLPEPAKKGIIAKVDPLSEDRISVSVLTNKETLSEDQMFFLILHNNGQLSQSAIARLGTGRTSRTFRFDKSELDPGINCLTVFNENLEPVAERLFYVSNQKIKGKVHTETNINQDTVTLEINTLNSNEHPVATYLSISVLPGGTISNDFTSSLLADVLLNSGIQGNIENPQYYFEKHNNERLTALDNLLLTQGWRKYDWTEILDPEPIELKYEFEKGYTIKGEVKNWLSGKYDIHSWVSLYSFENQFFDTAETDSLGNFAFTELFLPDSANVFITVVNKRDKGWNREVSSYVLPEYKADSFIDKPERYKRLHFTELDTLSTLPYLHEDVIQLDEVVITVKRPTYFNPDLFSGRGGTIIDEDNYYRHPNIQSLLFRKGVRYTQYSGGYIFDFGKDSQTFNPGIYIDGRQSSPTDLLNLCVQTIYQINVGEGYISVITRHRVGLPNLFADEVTKFNVNQLIVNGYSNPVAYFTPKYKVSPNDPDFIKYATVYWQPDIITDVDGEATVKFTVPPELDSIELRLEGITNDGTIFLENKEIELELSSTYSFPRKQ